MLTFKDSLLKNVAGASNSEIVDLMLDFDFDSYRVIPFGIMEKLPLITGSFLRRSAEKHHSCGFLFYNLPYATYYIVKITLIEHIFSTEDFMVTVGQHKVTPNSNFIRPFDNINAITKHDVLIEELKGMLELFDIFGYPYYINHPIMENLIKDSYAVQSEYEELLTINEFNNTIMYKVESDVLR